MKQSLFNKLVLVLVMVFTAMQIHAQKFSGLDKSPMDAAAFPTSYQEANKLIKIIYSRPQLKGRSLDQLAPEGKVWRTGANEAAELTLYVDMNLGGTKVPAGTYTFYVIPGKENYTAIISKDLNVWGSYFYKQENDVARMEVPVMSAEESLEAFSIAFDSSENGVDMFLGWDTMRVKVPFTK
jgi:hypothetical protein